MSNALAIATVTSTLRSIVETSAQKEVSGGVLVSTERPAAVAPGGPAIHLFLYQVLPDSSQRNNDLPSRTGDGTVRQLPTVAVNLHYLITFNDGPTSDPHKMMGAIVRDLHARPILPRSLIASVSTGDLDKSSRGTLGGRIYAHPPG